jgi:hypothetical protein
MFLRNGGKEAKMESKAFRKERRTVEDVKEGRKEGRKADKVNEGNEGKVKKTKEGTQERNAGERKEQGVEHGGEGPDVTRPACLGAIDNHVRRITNALSFRHSNLAVFTFSHICTVFFGTKGGIVFDEIGGSSGSGRKESN